MTRKRATLPTMTREQKLRFLGGRTRFNKTRTIESERRRREIVLMLRNVDLSERGWRSRLAEELGVHRGTVGRDLQKISADRKAKHRERTRQDHALLGDRLLAGIFEAHELIDSAEVEA